MTAPAPGDHQQQAAEVPPWGDDVEFGETCRRDARLRDQLADVIADWMAQPYKPEDWQRANADDLTADLLPYVHAYEADAYRRGARRITERMERLAEELRREAQRAAASTDPELAHPYLNAAARIRAALAEGNNDTEEMGK